MSPLAQCLPTAKSTIDPSRKLEGGHCLMPSTTVHSGKCLQEFRRFVRSAVGHLDIEVSYGFSGFMDVTERFFPHFPGAKTIFRIKNHRSSTPMMFRSERAFLGSKKVKKPTSTAHGRDATQWKWKFHHFQQQLHLQHLHGVLFIR